MISERERCSWKNYFYNWPPCNIMHKIYRVNVCRMISYIFTVPYASLFRRRIVFQSPLLRVYPFALTLPRSFPNYFLNCKIQYLPPWFLHIFKLIFSKYKMNILTSTKRHFSCRFAHPGWFFDCWFIWSKLMILFIFYKCVILAQFLQICN